MKFNKKVLIGLLTASCVVAGTFGLAACQGNGNQEEHEPQVTIGANGNLFVDGKDTGYKVKDENDDNENGGGEGETLIVDYVLQTPDGIYIYYTNGTYQEVPYIASSLSLSEENGIVLPKKGTTTYLSVNIPTGSAGTYQFDVGFTGMASYSTYTFTVNETELSIGNGKSENFCAALEEGDNLITITSTLANDTSATLSIASVTSGGKLNAGNNTLTFDKTYTFYSYEFTAEEDGDYIISAPYTDDDPCVLCVTTIDGTILLSDKQWIGEYDDDWDKTTIIGNSFTAKAGETVTLCIQVEEGELVEEAEYSLNIAKFVPPTVNVSEPDDDSDDAYTEILIDENGTKVSLNVETAGTYIVTVSFQRGTSGASVSLGEHTFSSDDNSSLTLELELEAGDNMVTFVYDTPDYWSPDITIWVKLVAKTAE